MTQIPLQGALTILIVLLLVGLVLLAKIAQNLAALVEIQLHLRLTLEEGQRTVRAGLDQLRDTYEHWNRPA